MVLSPKVPVRLCSRQQEQTAALWTRIWNLLPSHPRPMVEAWTPGCLGRLIEMAFAGLRGSDKPGVDPCAGENPA